MKIEGRERLKRKLAALPQLARDEIRPAMAQGADEIVALMKRMVRRKTGRGAESIGWTWGEAPKGAIAVGQVSAGGSDLTLTIYAGGGDAFHVRFLEFGTVNMPASPFFRPAMRLLRKRAMNRINRATARAARNVASMR